HFQDLMQEYVVGDIKIAKEPREASRNVDTIICVTQSKEKFLKNEWVEPGTVIFPMGSYQEVEDKLILNSDYIIVDHMEQALHRGVLKDLNEQGKITEDSIYDTIGEFANKTKTIDNYQNKTVICVPIGTGAVDIAVAKFALDKAQEKNVGEKFDFIQEYI